MRKIFPRAVLILVFLWVINQAGKFMYEPVTENLLLTAEELKENQGSIETLVLGSSLTNWGLDINVLNEKLDTRGFNLATDAQFMAGSYILLKDELKRNPIKRVFLGVGAASLKLDEDERGLPSKTRIMKLLLSPLSKAIFTLTLQPDEIEKVLFCPARIENVLSLHTVTRNVQYKLSEDYEQRISYSGADKTYYGLGYCSSSLRYTPTGRESSDRDYWDRDEADGESLTYIKKIGELCLKEGIELNLVVFPSSPSYAVKQGDLADMDAYLNDLAEEVSADLYNYNYTAREDIYEYLSDSEYMDVKHLNCYGAPIFTGLLADDYLSAHDQ